MSNLLLLEKTAFNSFKPPEKLSLSDWADQYAYLSTESSAEGGRWRTLPYQKGIMDAITNPDVEQVTLMKSARVGYSKILNHLIAYHMHQDSCPIMVVLPTLDDCQSYSKEELQPMLRDTPCLHGLVSDPKSKDGNNFVHTINGSGLAVGRCLIALIENNFDGKETINVPSCLEPYFGSNEIKVN